MKNNGFQKLPAEEFYMFFKSLKEAREVNSHGCFMSIQNPIYYASTQNFLLGKGIAGFAIKEDGDLIACHKNTLKAQKENLPSVMQDMMLKALTNGATKLDCYGDFLALTYEKFGFLPVALMNFKNNINPDWSVEEFGEVDIIAMEKGIDNIDELITRQQQDGFVDHFALKQQLPIFNDYESMKNYRDEVLEQSKDLNYEEKIEFILSKAQEVKIDEGQQTTDPIVFDAN